MTGKSFDTDAWRERWLQGNTPWDLGGVHQKTEELLALVEQCTQKAPAGRVLIPCCGHAHDVVTYVDRGCDVVAVDAVPEAIVAAEALYGQLPQVRFQTSDFFTYTADEAFDWVFDRAALCAMDPELWRPYLEACHRNLNTGGVFASVLFTSRKENPDGGPPFAMTFSQLMQATQGLFHFAGGYEYELNHPDKVIGTEGLVALVKI